MGERSRRRQAEAELQMAIKLDGSNVDYRVWLAELYRSVGLYRRALQELEHALSFDARHAEAQRLFREISGAVKSS
jgi:Tfp pilus assembly protein PilF